MRDQEEDDEAVEELAPLLEFGDTEEEHGDGEFADEEGDEDLTPIEVVVFEESGVIFLLDVEAVSSKTPKDFLNDQAHTDRVRDLSVN